MIAIINKPAEKVHSFDDEFRRIILLSSKDMSPDLAFRTGPDIRRQRRDPVGRFRI